MTVACIQPGISMICKGFLREAVLWRADDPKEQIEESLFNRSQEFKARRESQIQTVDFPTTTIGSFPQTAGAHSLSHFVTLRQQ